LGFVKLETQSTGTVSGAFLSRSSFSFLALSVASFRSRFSRSFWAFCSAARRARFLVSTLYCLSLFPFLPFQFFQMKSNGYSQEFQTAFFVLAQINVLVGAQANGDGGIFIPTNQNGKNALAVAFGKGDLTPHPF
jgi:hypothetical protein